MQNYGRDALAFKSLFQVLGANTGSSAEFAGRLTLQRNAAATTLINNRAQQQFGEAREHREQLQEVCSDALKVRAICTFVCTQTQGTYTNAIHCLSAVGQESGGADPGAEGEAFGEE